MWGLLIVLGANCAEEEKPSKDTASHDDSGADTDGDTSTFDTSTEWEVTVELLAPAAEERVSATGFAIEVLINVEPVLNYDGFTWALYEDGVSIADGMVTAQYFEIDAGARPAGPHVYLVEVSGRGVADLEELILLVNAVPTIRVDAAESYTSCTEASVGFTVTDDDVVDGRTLTLTETRQTAEGGVVATPYTLVLSDPDGDGVGSAELPDTFVFSYESPIDWEVHYTDDLDPATTSQSATIEIPPDSAPIVTVVSPEDRGRSLYDNDTDTTPDSSDAAITFEVADDCTEADLESVVAMSSNGSNTGAGNLEDSVMEAWIAEEWTIYCDIAEAEMWEIELDVTDVDGQTTTVTLGHVWFVDGTCFDVDGDGYIDGEEDATDPFCSADMLSRYGEYYGDCDDAEATTNPGAAELCDDVDNDCDDENNEHALDVADVAGEGESVATAVSLGGFDADGTGTTSTYHDTLTASAYLPTLHDDGDVDWWSWEVDPITRASEEVNLTITLSFPAAGTYSAVLYKNGSPTTTTATGNGNLVLTATGVTGFDESSYSVGVTATTWDSDACDVGYTVTVLEN